MPTRKPVSEDAVRRERAGTYRTVDGRFTLESSSSGWLLLDRDQTDGMGLPLTRGPFATLDAAKTAIGPARGSSPPASDLTVRASRAPIRRERRTPVPGRAAAPVRSRPAQAVATAPRARPAVVVREIRGVDGDALRELWAEAGFGSLGDDDLSLARLARRNPGLVLVAAEGSRVVGSALGAWDGRRGWIYHVATAPTHRRQGIATRLIDQIEAGMRALGCRKVNVMVRPDSDGGAEFWANRGYGPSTATQYGKELERD